jgi:hypothetical protein
MKLALSLVLAAGLVTAAQADQTTFAPMALNSLTRVPAALATATVMDQNGRAIGKVQRVVADQNGRPAGISYLTGQGKLVVVAAPAISYDGQRNILVMADSPQLLALK